MAYNMGLSPVHTAKRTNITLSLSPLVLVDAPIAKILLYHSFDSIAAQQQQQQRLRSIRRAITNATATAAIAAECGAQKKCENNFDLCAQNRNLCRYHWV